MENLFILLQLCMVTALMKVSNSVQICNWRIATISASAGPLVTYCPLVITH